MYILHMSLVGWLLGPPDNITEIVRKKMELCAVQVVRVVLPYGDRGHEPGASD